MIRHKQIMQESAGDEEILSWTAGVGGAMDKWVPGGLFAQNFQTAESLAKSDTNSSSYQQKLRITLPATLPAGTYRLEWSACFDQDSDSDLTYIRVQVDDTTTLIEVAATTLWERSGYDLRHPIEGYADVVLTAGSHYFDLDWRTSDTGETASIADARFAVWRLL